MEESRKQQDWFCIKLYVFFFARDYLHFGCTKTLFSTQVKYYKFQLGNSKIQNIIFNLRKLLFNASTKFKTQTLFFLMQRNRCKFQLQIQNHRRYVNVSRNIIT